MFAIFCLYIASTSVVSDSLFNAALYKPAYVSSVYTTIPLPASNANDGNDSVSLDSCTHTNVDDPGWWMVDLRGLYRVEQIVLVNRGDDYNSSLRTQNYQFDVFRSDPRLSSDPGEVCYKRVEPVGQGATLTQNCEYPIMGRFVRFTRFGLDNINICEVKVMISYASYRDYYFTVTRNNFLQVSPFLTTITTSALACTALCQRRRDSDTCTAVNWVRTTKLCQMLKIDPRIKFTLTSDGNTDFYMEA